MKPLCLSNISLSKATFASTVFSSKPVCPINICPSKPVHPSNVCSSKPVCPSNDCQSKLVSPVDVCMQNPWFVMKALILNLFLVLLLFQHILSLA